MRNWLESYGMREIIKRAAAICYSSLCVRSLIYILT